jgi:hypothetical protein
LLWLLAAKKKKLLHLLPLLLFPHLLHRLTLLLLLLFPHLLLRHRLTLLLHLPLPHLLLRHRLTLLLLLLLLQAHRHRSNRQII